MVPSCAPDWEYGELVSETHGKFSLGLVSTGVGLAGIMISVFLWKEAPGTVRMLGPLSRSLAGIEGLYRSSQESAYYKKLASDFNQFGSCGGLTPGCCF